MNDHNGVIMTSACMMWPVTHIGFALETTTVLGSVFLQTGDVADRSRSTFSLLTPLLVASTEKHT